MNALFEGIAHQLLEKSIVIADDVLPRRVLLELGEEAKEHFNAGEFHKAEVGKGIEKQRISEVRGDKVLWLNKAEATNAQSEYWNFVDGLRGHLSEFFRIHLERTELHFAVYPSGAFYAPHLDQFRDHSNRIFSIILYLNDGWQAGDGGELRVHYENSFEEFAPLMGRLICFRSDTILHEVLEAKRPRMSITGWMRRDAFLI